MINFALSQVRAELMGWLSHPENADHEAPRARDRKHYRWSSGRG